MDSTFTQQVNKVVFKNILSKNSGYPIIEKTKAFDEVFEMPIMPKQNI